MYGVDATLGYQEDDKKSMIVYSPLDAIRILLYVHSQTYTLVEETLS